MKEMERRGSPIDLESSLYLHRGLERETGTKGLGGIGLRRHNGRGGKQLDNHLPDDK